MSMQLSQFQRELIKSPRYAGSSLDLKPYYRKMPMPWELNITKVPNTIITCTGCNGAGFIAQRHRDGLGLITYETCPICSGTKQISNNPEGGR